MFYVNSRAIIERFSGDETEIILQRRTKPDSLFKLELPGGRIDPFESLIEALIREVKEETGLDISKIEDVETRVDTAGMNPAFEVECLKPFAAYQTIKGPVDSVGLYFRCQATGNLLEIGDDTSEIKWMNVKEVRDLFRQDPLGFSDVDRAGIKYYLKFKGLLT
ncbi:NUDIX hydrolase [Paenibacillus physcomitrellae]|uniref:DNA mismatch repair protein MutT n=1 Tax=Paenibacillus physcomitrellae TaxID=1619311 RepID=A0ABQ1FPA9_9BACL|nr:NUDIX hydrolase [Paenibacillus physcomitrellae]GGA24078.1 DNA mismatch repair protein MutT [Paenibacillus physcomitrellae]